MCVGFLITPTSRARPPPPFSSNNVNPHPTFANQIILRDGLSSAWRDEAYWSSGTSLPSPTVSCGSGWVVARGSNGGWEARRADGDGEVEARGKAEMQLNWSVVEGGDRRPVVLAWDVAGASVWEVRPHGPGDEGA